MSEEILKALMQLFAIISKQDDGASVLQRKFVEEFLSFQLAADKVPEYIALYDNHLNDGEKADGAGEDGEKKEKKLTSVKDSVRTLAICKKINKTLSQKQKVVVLIRLFELMKSNNQFTPQRVGIIDTVSTVFNINAEELKLVRHFITSDDPYTQEMEDLLVIDSNEIPAHHLPGQALKHIFSDGLHGIISIIRVKSVDLYFIKYNGTNDIFLNGLPFNHKTIYLLASGATLRLPQGTVYYSDIISHFLSDKTYAKLSFHAKHIGYKFPNGTIGLHDVTLAESSGKLIGLMGASGAGKTTLLNVLSGIEKPSSGEVLINGVNIFQEKKKIEGIIGYIAQDDLLIEELTVFENLYYNAKLCFKDLSENELRSRVEKTLEMLGLLERKDVKVGSPLDKKISGGQRKRLNIALELIREPSVLFVDEPTSGLSSRDSENVMDLLKELSLKGKLIFVVIHQPSSDIYKMFDRLVLLDTGGYQIYYGNPIEAVVYFKKASNQVNADAGECHACGNVNPEQLFNIIESKVVDEFGQYHNERKVKPKEWNERYLISVKPNEVEVEKVVPEKSFSIPGKLKQLIVFVQRDVKSKISNVQYLLINLLEAPLLAFILAFIIRQKNNAEEAGYVFKNNENIPAYIFMCITVSLFIGLTVSAEEIFKDKKILKRESLLNLSRTSYLFSKILILFSISAFQMLCFVMVGNLMLDIEDMGLAYWLMLFSISCFSNVLGLNMSQTFNSAVTIYISIPLLIIPQMILGGAMFDFDKLNDWLGGGNGKKTPVISEFIAARWAFEGLAVHQYKNNAYEYPVYDFNKKESICNYKQAYYIPKLEDLLTDCESFLDTAKNKNNESYRKKLDVIRNEIVKETGIITTVPCDVTDKINPENFSKEIAEEVGDYLKELASFYITVYDNIHRQKRIVIDETTKQLGEEGYESLRKQSFNESLSDLVRKTTAKSRITIDDAQLIQITDPVYKDPESAGGLDFRAHFYAPEKKFLNGSYDTFWFNLSMIWFMTVLLYASLHFKLFEWIGNKLKPVKTEV